MKMVYFCEKVHFRFLYTPSLTKNWNPETEIWKQITIFALTIQLLKPDSNEKN